MRAALVVYFELNNKTTTKNHSVCVHRVCCCMGLVKWCENMYYIVVIENGFYSYLCSIFICEPIWPHFHVEKDVSI